MYCVLAMLFLRSQKKIDIKAAHFDLTLKVNPTTIPRKRKGFTFNVK